MLLQNVPRLYRGVSVYSDKKQLERIYQLQRLKQDLGLRTLIFEKYLNWELLSTEFLVHEAWDGVEKLLRFFMITK